MPHHNGLVSFVIRTAYPQGFTGEEVDICSMLRLFAAEMRRRAAPRLWKVAEILLQYFIGPLFLFFYVSIGTILASAYGLLSNGALIVIPWREGPAFTREIRIPILYKIGNVRPLPLFWVAVGMLAWCLLSLFPAFMVLLVVPGNNSGTLGPLFHVTLALTFPVLVWNILNGPLNRERLTKKTAEAAPFLAQKVEDLPWVRSAMEVLALLRLAVAGWRKKFCIKVKVKD